MPMLFLVLAFVSGSVQTQPLLQHEDMVRVVSAGVPAAMAARIAAVPGDRVVINDSGIYVNDVAVTGLSTEFTEGAGRVESLTVPEGHYVVVGEVRDGLSVSRYWALTAAGNIERIEP